MINGYIKPQLKIRQLLERVPDVPQIILSTFVLGPRYHLMRYTSESEKALMKGSEFLYNDDETPESRQLLEYEKFDPLTVIDKESVRIYGENLEAQVAELKSEAYAAETVSYNIKIRGTDPSKLQFYEQGSDDEDTEPVNIGEATFDLHPDLNGRPISIGDIIYSTVEVSGNKYTSRRFVIGFERAPEPASFGVDSDRNNKLAAASISNAKDTDYLFTAELRPGGVGFHDIEAYVGIWSGNVTGATLGGENSRKTGDKYIFTCSQAGTAATSRWRIRSASGLHSADNVQSILLRDPVETEPVVAPAVHTYLDYIVFAHPVLNGLVVRAKIDSQDINFYAGARYEFTIYCDHTAIDLIGDPNNLDGGGNPAPIPPQLDLSVNDSAYFGDRDTTYVVTVVKGNTSNEFAPIRILAYQDSKTVLTRPDEAQNTGDYYAKGYVPGLFCSLSKDELGSIAFKRSANGVVTAVNASDGSAIVGDGPFTSEWRNKTLYLIEDAAHTNFNTAHPRGLENPNGKHLFDGAVLHVSDTNGIDEPIEVRLSSVAKESSIFSVGTLGIRAKFGDVSAITQEGLRRGDTYYVHAKAQANTGPINTVILSSRVASTEDWLESDFETNEFDIKVCYNYNGVIPFVSNVPGEQYEPTQDGVYLRHRAKVFVPGIEDDAYAWAPVIGRQPNGYDSEGNPSSTLLPYNGKLFVSYRSFIPTEPGREIKLTGIVPEDAGVIDIDNPYAYGLSRALSGAQGRMVYAAPVESDDIAGYRLLLRQASNIEGVYAVAPMTYDREIQVLVKDHCVAMSSETKKLWRRCYVATESPGTYARVYVDSEGGPVKASILSHELGNVRLVSNNANFVSNNVKPGDILRVNYAKDMWGNETYDTFTVRSVLDDNEALLLAGPEDMISIATKIEVWAPDTARTQAEYIAAVSKGFGSRRCSNVWCERPTVVTLAGNLRTCPVIYGAAEVAGLRSALFPQQGLTRTEIRSFAAAAAMYTKYTDDELDIAASNGTFIITQEKPGGSIFIRHQLTTDAANGILYYEDSVGVIIDEISYRLKSILEPYIGKRNADPGVIREIKAHIRAVLTDRMSAPPGQDMVGPAVLAFRNLVVQVDRYRVDTINANVTITVPTPLNVLDVTLNAVANRGENAITVEVTEQ